jgi:hypothetical protein
MTAYSDELVSLEELRSVLGAYAGPADPRVRAKRSGLRRFRPVLVFVIAVVAFVIASVAIADGLGAFNGIGAAHHPRTGADEISPSIKADMGYGSQPVPRGLDFGTTRRIGQLPSGQNVYVIAPTRGNGTFCFVIGRPGPEWNCSATLSRRHPSTAIVYTGDGKPWTTVGIALNGVTSVSFKVGGPEHGGKESGGHIVTVPVKHNLWTYRSHDELSLAQASWLLTAHFADGTTAVDRCPAC